MENELDPNFVPDEYKVPYDVLELPSQGLLYDNKKSSVKVEYLTAMDENVLVSPNILNSGRVLDVLLERKVKNLGFPVGELLDGDRVALLLFLRTTSFGEEFKQGVINKDGDVVEGTIDLSELKQRKLTIKPDENNEFDFELPKGKQKIKFRFLNGVDEKDVEDKDMLMKKRFDTDISFALTLKLEKIIMSINGNRDKMFIGNYIKTMTILDSRSLNKYIRENEPGIDFETKARIQGGESVDTFLRINKSFFWPEL